MRGVNHEKKGLENRGHKKHMRGVNHEKKGLENRGHKKTYEGGKS